MKNSFYTQFYRVTQIVLRKQNCHIWFRTFRFFRGTWLNVSPCLPNLDTILSERVTPYHLDR
jgi:hypothetical protein